jgi:hypothetical protein
MLWPSVKFFCLSRSSNYDRIHTENKLFDAELFQECCHFPNEKLNISDAHNSV